MNMMQMARDTNKQNNYSFLVIDEDEIDFSSIEKEFLRDAPSDTYLKSIAKTIQQEEKTSVTNVLDDFEPIPLEDISQAAEWEKQIISDDEEERPIEAFPDDDLPNNEFTPQQQLTASSHSVVSFTSSSSERDFPPAVPAVGIAARQTGDANESFPNIHDMERIFNESSFPVEEIDTKNGTSTRFRDYQKEKWEKRYNELAQVFRETGRSSVHHADASRKGLARWIKRQRAQYKLRNEGKPSSMIDERVEALERINFVWDSHSTAWEDRISELTTFRAKYGHCNISSSNAPVSKTLVSWIKCQRRQYRLMVEGKKSSLTQKRVRQLKNLGFQFC